MKRASFANLAYESKKRKTRREKFLEEMNEVIPWEELLQVIGPYYPRAGNGRQPLPPILLENHQQTKGSI